MVICSSRSIRAPSPSPRVFWRWTRRCRAAPHTGKALAELRDAGTAVLPGSAEGRGSKGACAVAGGDRRRARRGVGTLQCRTHVRAARSDPPRRAPGRPRGRRSEDMCAGDRSVSSRVVDRSGEHHALCGFDDVQRRMLERAITCASRRQTRCSIRPNRSRRQFARARCTLASDGVPVQRRRKQLASFRDAVAANDIDAANKALEVLRKVVDDAGQIKDLDARSSTFACMVASRRVSVSATPWPTGDGHSPWWCRWANC